MTRSLLVAGLALLAGCRPAAKPPMAYLAPGGLYAVLIAPDGLTVKDRERAGRLGWRRVGAALTAIDPEGSVPVPGVSTCPNEAPAIRVGEDLALEPLPICHQQLLQYR